MALGIKLIMMAIASAVLLSFATSETTMSAPNQNQVKSDVLGEAEMLQNGQLRIIFMDSSYKPIVLKPNEADYTFWLQVLGGLKPGEKKPIIRYDGYVVMNNDLSLSVFSTGQVEGGAFVEPSMSQVKPNSTLYRSIIKRVGGLVPGQRKGIPAKSE